MYKKIVSLLAISSLSVSALFGASAKQRSDLGSLVVQVQAPLSGSLLNEREYEQSMIQVLDESLDRAGYTAKLDEGNEADFTKGERLLEVRIIRWGIDRVGNAQCEFTAQVSDASGTRQLGVFNGMGLGFSAGSGSFGRSRLLESAGIAAGNDLWREFGRVAH